MAEFIQQIVAPIWDSERLLTFSDPSGIAAWATSELDFWTVPGEAPHPNLRSQYELQRSHFQNILSMLPEVERAAARTDAGAEQHRRQIEGQVATNLSPISTGTILTSECRQFEALSRLRKSDSNAFVLLSIASRSNARDVLPSIDSGTTLAFLAKSALGGVALSGKADSTVYKNELARLKNKHEKEIAVLMGRLAQFESDSQSAAASEEAAQLTRQGEWNTQRNGIDQDWLDLKRLYAEKMALAAPTTYWANRAATSGRHSGWLAVAFAVTAGVSMVLFFEVAVPHLANIPKDTSPFIVLLPVIAPAFVAIWVLRILGRHLSESIQLVRDARERETMVTTFLALMNDQSTGKTLVRDEDRLLILQALFRQSAITATDDSPPIHWAEMFKRR